MRSAPSPAFVKLLKKIQHQEDVGLHHFSTLKVGGKARYLAMPNSLEELAELQLACREHELDLHVLGGGSNTLFSDEGFLGVAVKLGSSFDFIRHEADGSMTVGAATSLAKTTKLAIGKAWTQAVGLSGIPGALGGAISMNAGTRLGEIKDVFVRLHGVENGQAIVLEKKDIEFGYRQSNLSKDIIICHAELAYDKNLFQPVSLLMDTMRAYQQKRKLSQPSVNSLGSFFKNPYPQFAAQLIESCDLKGIEYKGAQISPLHANFIVNNGDASAKDILYIASMAQEAVFEKYGLVLQPEVRMVGNFYPKNPLCSTRFDQC